MTANDLLLGAGSIDETLIDEALQAEPARRFPVKWAAAACLCLIAALAAPTAVRQLRAEPHETSPAPAHEALERPERPAPPLISSYGTETSNACYVTPENGAVNRSVPLRSALDEYGDSAEYLIVVDLFADRKLLDPTGGEVRAEIRRLEETCGVGLERYYDPDTLELIAAYFTLRCDRGALESFPSDPRYGYMLFLHDECTGWIPPDAVIVAGDPDAPEKREGVSAGAPSGEVSAAFGGSYTDADGVLVVLLTADTPENRAAVCAELGAAEEAVRFRPAEFSLAYLTEVQDRIGGAMAAGELPEVVSAGVYETENRVVVFASGADGALRGRLADFDPLGAVRLESAAAAIVD